MVRLADKAKAYGMVCGHLLVCLVCLDFLVCGAAWGQQPIGSVAMSDATVAGSLEVTGGRAVLLGNSSVTARDYAAEVTLRAGGGSGEGLSDERFAFVFWSGGGCGGLR